MRKIVSISMIALVVLICGCHHGKTYKLGVSQCSNDDWRMKMNEEINREIMFHDDAMVEIRSADDDNDKQIADIRYFADNGFDIIIAAPNEAGAITPVIKEVYGKGIPVVIFDRNINGDTYTAYQGVDNTEIGRAAARYLRNIAGPDVRVMELYGLRGSTPAIERHDGFANECLALGNMDIVATAHGNWNYDDAALVADSLFGLYPDVNAVYAHNDRMAIAASEVARHKGLDVKVIGIDAAPEIGIRAVADSVIDATFLYPTEGHRLVRTALSILKGEPYDTVTRLPLASAVDLTNADILLLQNESLKEETEKIHVLKSQVDDYWSRHSAQTSLLYAAIAILVLLFGVIFLMLRAFWQHKHHQRVLLENNRLLEEQRDIQKTLNEQLNEATQAKLVFFTNVSHDLRTPLTLIAEPVEQLASAGNLTPQQHTLMHIANKNVKILRRLINQILDFRKYENGKLDINLVEVDFGRLVREWTESFVSIAARRDIKLELELPDGELRMAIDAEKVERVFFNLMSNAFKYTPDNGTIRFSCRYDGAELMFRVTDTGIGINASELGNIFDRFYQVDKVKPKGSGIGLSLAKAFVELHGGNITVTSEEGKGTEFTVTIPVRHVADVAVVTHNNIGEAEVTSELAPVDDGQVVAVDPDKPLMLVVDDNDDMLRLLTAVMSDEYNIITASNGQQGVRKAVKYVPDIVVCDVMMPVMDGLECCRLIKEEVSTSHIPVLLLTACSMDEQRVQGYESGADGYVAKPFDGKVLKARCRSLIVNRKRIRDLWSGTAVLPSAAEPRPADCKPHMKSDIDSEFYNKFLDLFKADMSNPDMNVDMLASRMGLGRSQFYRKIKALTNYSPVELIRNLRLKHARVLLTGTEKTISEIAYEVGFSTPAYFTKCYREAFGETPTDLRERTSTGRV